MIAYKLTDTLHQTYGGTQWYANGVHTTPGKGNLCSKGWIHVYEHPLLAVLHNPIHASFNPAVLWECEVSGPFLRDGYLKMGVAVCRTCRILPLPKISPLQCIAYGIGCALHGFCYPHFRKWATEWLNGTDRSVDNGVDVYSSGIINTAAAHLAFTAAFSRTYAYHVAEAASAATVGQHATHFSAAGDIDLIRIANWAVGSEQEVWEMPWRKVDGSEA